MKNRHKISDRARSAVLDSALQRVRPQAVTADAGGRRFAVQILNQQHALAVPRDAASRPEAVFSRPDRGSVYSFPARLVGSTETAWLLIGSLLVCVYGRPRLAVKTAVAAAVPLLVVGAVSVVGPSFWVIRYVLYVLMPDTIVTAAGFVHACAGLRPRIAVARVLAPS